MDLPDCWGFDGSVIAWNIKVKTESDMLEIGPGSGR